MSNGIEIAGDIAGMFVEEEGEAGAWLELAETIYDVWDVSDEPTTAPPPAPAPPVIDPSQFPLAYVTPMQPTRPARPYAAIVEQQRERKEAWSSGEVALLALGGLGVLGIGTLAIAGIAYAVTR